MQKRLQKLFEKAKIIDAFIITVIQNPLKIEQKYREQVSAAVRRKQTSERSERTSERTRPITSVPILLGSESQFIEETAPTLISGSAINV